MALSIETLRGNSLLATLSDEQLSAIAEMSTNDESNVVNTKIGALHGLYDADILKITGVAKNAGEKSYDYMKRVLNDYKTNLGTATTDIEALKATKAELERKIADGSADAALKQKLADTETRLSQLQTQYDTDKTNYAKTIADLKKREKDIQVGYIFDQAVSGLSFKDGITDSIKNLLLKDARAQVLAKGTPEFIDDGMGGTKLIFRDKNGQILNNPDNNLNPYTAKELLLTIPSLKEVLGGALAGGGTGPETLSVNTVPSLAQARTQVEADELIAKQLMSQGLTRYSAEFINKFNELRAQAGVDKLPLR